MTSFCTPSVECRGRTESEQTFQIPFLCSETLEKVNSQAVAYPIKKGLNFLYLNGVRDKDSSSVHRCSIAHSCCVTTYMVFYLLAYVLCYAYCRLPTNSSCVTIIIVYRLFHSIHNYMSQANHVFGIYNVAAILWSQFMVTGILILMVNVLYFILVLCYCYYYYHHYYNRIIIIIIITCQHGRLCWRHDLCQLRCVGCAQN